MVLKDCPRCGANRISADKRLCYDCNELEFDEEQTACIGSTARFATLATAQVGDYILHWSRPFPGRDVIKYQAERVVRVTKKSLWIERQDEPVRRDEDTNFVDAPDAECRALLQHYRAWWRLHRALGIGSKAASLPPGFYSHGLVPQTSWTPPTAKMKRLRTWSREQIAILRAALRAVVEAKEEVAALQAALQAARKAAAPPATQ